MPTQDPENTPTPPPAPSGTEYVVVSTNPQPGLATIDGVNYTHGCVVTLTPDQLAGAVTSTGTALLTTADIEARIANGDFLLV